MLRVSLTAFWDYWETARFGPNSGREPFGAKFWQFGGFKAAIKTAFWNYWETARFGPNPSREPFGAKFWLGSHAARNSATKHCK